MMMKMIEEVDLKAKVLSLKGLRVKARIRVNLKERRVLKE